MNFQVHSSCGTLSVDQAIFRVLTTDNAKDMDTYAANGGRTFETAAIYGNFQSEPVSPCEKLLGDWLKTMNRDEFVIITKGGHYNLASSDISRITPECIAIDIENSLKNLDVGAIDIYMLHRDNPSAPVEPIIDVLNTYVSNGKIKAIGTVNWTVSRIREANAYAESKGLQPFTISEVSWGLAPEIVNETDEVFMTKDEYNEYLKLGLPVLTEFHLQDNAFINYCKDGVILDRFRSKATRLIFNEAKRISDERGIAPEVLLNSFITNNALTSGYITSTPVTESVNLSKAEMVSLLYPWTTDDCLYEGITRISASRIINVAGLELSRIILGTTNIADTRDFELLDSYFDAGGRTFDTAKVYGTWGEEPKSVSELILGEWIELRGIRKEVQIITKGCHPDLSEPGNKRVNAKAIDLDLADSLANLRTDYIDIYQLHRDDPDEPVSGIMLSLDQHVKSGKIRAIGVSNWTTARIQEANEYARLHGLTEFTSSEVQLSLAVMNVGAMGDDIPEVTENDLGYYKENNIPVLAWGSIAGGYIMKCAKGQKDKVKQRSTYENPKSDWRVKNAIAVARDSGLSITELCVAYVTNHPVNAAALFSASNQKQLADVFKASRLVLSQEVIGDLYYIPKNIKSAPAKKELTLHDPFDLNTPLGLMFDFFDAIPQLANQFNENKAMLPLIKKMTFSQIMGFPQSEGIFTEESVCTILAVLNEKRIESLNRL